MPSLQTNPNTQLAEQGFLILQNVYSTDEVEQMRTLLDEALHSDDLIQHESVRAREGAVYAARNVLELFPAAKTIWQKTAIMDLLTEQLGNRVGLVRCLYFDKPPNQTWALPWHKDMLIAVADNPPASARYSRPRPRAGVLHTEPPLEVLQSMLTLRIHLDDMTEANGPLEVLPGTHLTGKELRIENFQPIRIMGQRGDVLAMRPLLAHCSKRSLPECSSSRRILHLEFAASPELPDGFQWHTFLPLVMET